MREGYARELAVVVRSAILGGDRSGIVTGPGGAATIVHALNSQEFKANFAGAWTMKQDPRRGKIPNVFQSWSPDDHSNTWNTGHWSVPVGTRVVITDVRGKKWAGALDVPRTYTVTYTATDVSDGATCQVTYALTAHDPIEVRTETVSAVTGIRARLVRRGASSTKVRPAPCQPRRALTTTLR